MQVHLDFAKDFGYLSVEQYMDLKAAYARLGRRLYALRAKAKILSSKR